MNTRTFVLALIAELRNSEFPGHAPTAPELADCLAVALDKAGGVVSLHDCLTDLAERLDTLIVHLGDDESRRGAEIVADLRRLIEQERPT